MKYILILLMIGGRVDGQSFECPCKVDGAGWPIFSNRHLSDDTTIVLKYTYINPKEYNESNNFKYSSSSVAIDTGIRAGWFYTQELPNTFGSIKQPVDKWVQMPKDVSFLFTDSCQRYRDSVAKYDFNIKMWQRKKGPNMTQLERVAVDAILKDLQEHRDGFMDKAKKCKP